MAASEVGVAYITLLPSAKGFKAALQRELGSDLARAGKQGGEDYGKGFERAASDRAKRVGSGLSGAIGPDARRAGDKSGDDFGKAFETSGTSRAKRLGSGLRNLVNRDARRAGDAAGEDFGDAFAESAEDGISTKLKVGAAAGAALAGGVLVAGVGEALERGKLNSKLAAQLGPGPQTKRATQAATKLFAGAWGDSVADVNDAVASVTMNVKGMRRASQRELQSVTASVLDIATAFDQDATSITRATDQLIRTDLARGPREALDIITRGFQTGANEADDLLDTFAEYGTQFRKLGFDGKQATGLLTQGLQAGARDADVVADAFKEFSIRAVDGSDLTQQSFEALGLSAQDMESKISRGGQSAADATALVLDKIRRVKDPADRAQIAVGLFGTQSEDLGDALFALDPRNAVDALGKVGGAAKRMGNTLNDNAATRLESFKRGMQTKFVNFLGNDVIPAAEGLWREVGPDVRKFGRSLANMGEDIGPVVEDTLPIFANVMGDVAGAVGKFATAFNKLPAPVQTALVTGGLFALIRGRRGGGFGGGGAASALGAGLAAGAATGDGGGRRGGRTGRRVAGGAVGALLGLPLLGDLVGAPSTPGTGERRRAWIQDMRDAHGALHQLGDDLGDLDTTNFFGMFNDFDQLDSKIARLLRSNPDRAMELLRKAARQAQVPLGALAREYLPETSDQLRLNARMTRGAREGGESLFKLWRSNLIPSAKNLADRFNLNSREAKQLRNVLGDTTRTGKAHEKQLREVAQQLGLNKRETNELIRRYGAIPQKVGTKAEFLTAEAERKRDNFLKATKGKFADLGNNTYAILVNGQSGHGRIPEAFAAGGAVTTHLPARRLFA